jgi:hypothetical protein
MRKLKQKKSKKSGVWSTILKIKLLVAPFFTYYGYLHFTLHARQEIREDWNTVSSMAGSMAGKGLALAKKQVDPNAIPCDPPQPFENGPMMCLLLPLQQ